MPKAKGFQNGAKIDAKMHQKSMPKLVSKKIRKIRKIHVSLNGKIIETHQKNKRFGCFRRLHVRTEKVSNKHQKLNQNPSTNRKTIDTNFIFEKVMHKLQKLIQKWNPKGIPKNIKNLSKINSKKGRKTVIRPTQTRETLRSSKTT